MDNDLLVSKMGTIERCCKRARDEYEKDPTTFVGDITRQDAATLNVIRAYAGEGRQRLVYYRMLRKQLESDATMRAFFEGESTIVPRFYVDRIRNDLQGYWDALPKDALYHDQNAYLRSTAKSSQPKVVSASIGSNAAPAMAADAGRKSCSA